MGYWIMDSEVIDKVNSLTEGDLAKNYFSKKGLKKSDAKEIKDILIQRLENNEICADDIEKELQLLINKYRYEKEIVKKDPVLSKNDSEKELIFRLNNNFKGFKCRNCNHVLIGEFNYCPKCGSENEIRKYKIVAPESIDLDKGFVTPDELRVLKFLTQEEIALLKDGKKTIEELGIQVTLENCPIEIRNQILYKNANFRNDVDRRRKVFDDHVNFYNSQGNKYKLSSFNKRVTVSAKKFPVSSKLEQPQETIRRELLKREFLIHDKESEESENPQ